MVNFLCGLLIALSFYMLYIILKPKPTRKLKINRTSQLYTTWYKIDNNKTEVLVTHIDNKKVEYYYTKVNGNRVEPSKIYKEPLKEFKKIFIRK